MTTAAAEMTPPVPPADAPKPRPAIALSRKPQDLAYVAGILRSRALDPKPVPGYAEMPGAWDESSRFKRVVERYGWGSIMFLSDRERNEHATLVIEGEVDLDSGKIKTRTNKVVAIPVAWYKELAEAFPTKGKPAHLPTLIDIPGCLGYHQPDVTCDGGINEHSQVEKPCGWRHRCIPLQRFCADKGSVPEKLLKGKSPEWVVEATAVLVNKYGAPAAPPPLPEGEGSAVTALNAEPSAAEDAAGSTQARPPKATHRPKSQPSKVSKPEAGDVDPEGTLQALWSALQAAFPERQWHMGEGEGKVGEVFISDRRNPSGYVSVYARPESGHRVAIMSFRLRRRMAGVQLPIPKGHALLADVDANTVAWKDGAFLSEVKPVPQAVSVEAVAAIIKGAVEQGLIKLPPA